MRALITGINGFVGGYLAEHLLAQANWEVWGQSRSTMLHLPTLAGQVQLVCCDLMDRQATRQMLEQIQPDVIFHLSGQPFVPVAFENPADTLATNTLGALHLIQGLLDLQLACRLVVIGTNEEYGAIQPEDLPINEDTPLRPSNPYGVSKAAQTLLALQYHRSHKLDVVCMRPCTHIGPRQNGRFVSAAFARQVALIEAGRQPPLIEVGNLAAQRDFSDVRDIVAGYALAATKATAGMVYNIGSGNAIAVRAILDDLLTISGVQAEVRIAPHLLRPIDIPLVVCDPSRFRAATGWQARYTLADTLRDILDDWRERIRLEMN